MILFTSSLIWKQLEYFSDNYAVAAKANTKKQHLDPPRLGKDTSKNSEIEISVIVDAFRAFTTASYILDQNPSSYILSNKSEILCKLSQNYSYPVFIGKSEIGATLEYDIPNSPTRTQELDLKEKHVFHRSSAGAKGVIEAKEADVVLAVSFVNAEATAKYILSFNNPKISIIPMGHEGNTSSLEDELCSDYLKALLKKKIIDITPYISTLKKGPGGYFFQDDQWQYPEEDFKTCLETKKFDFAIKADVKDGYAYLKRIDVNTTL